MVLRGLSWILAIGLTISESTRPIGLFLVNLALLPLSCRLAIIPHELGHAAVAKIMGLRVFRAIFGRGKTLITFRLFNIPCDVNAYPVDAVVVAGHVTKDWFRVKQFLFASAGPLANVIIAVVLWHACGMTLRPELASLFEHLQPAVMFFLANVFMAELNLFPFTYMSVLGPIASDGKQMLGAPFLKPKDVDASLASTPMLEAQEFFGKEDYESAAKVLKDAANRFPAHPFIPLMQGFTELSLSNLDESRGYSLAAAERLSGDPAQQAIAYNNIAYVDAVLARPELATEADDLSKKAQEALPWLNFVKGTRGTVLVQFGEFEEGRRLLEEASSIAELATSKAENFSWLAIASVRQGAIQEAERLLETARELDPRCKIIPRVEEALRSRESSSPWTRLPQGFPATVPSP